MNQVIYIAGCGHSGSTLLGLVLGQHSRLVGLGEVHAVLDANGGEAGFRHAHEKQSPCSCGKTIDGCKFWSAVESKVHAKGGARYAEQYGAVLETLKEQYGNEASIVDSSKGIGPLREILATTDNVRVLHLMRDVRAYSISQLERASVRKSRGLHVSRKRMNWLFDLFMSTASYHFLDWYRQNSRIQKFLREKGIQTMQLGYEELCLYPEKTIGKVCEFLGLEMEASMLSLNELTRSHILRGNRMRAQKKKRAISYDNRWFYRTEWMVPSVFLYPILRYNRKEVYRNTAGSFWEEKRGKKS